MTAANATVNVSGYSGVYDAGAHGATGTAQGVFGEDLSNLLNFGAKFTNAPGGTATWTFAGNTNYNAASGSVPIVINQASTTTTVTSSLASSYYGQSITFKATVVAQPPGAGKPDGAVQFLDNGLVLATVTLVNGKASWTTAALGVGANAITVNYLGSGNFQASSTSAPLAQPVTVGILLLDANSAGALTDSGKVIVQGSSIVVDSSNAAAVVVSGTGSVQASQIDISGGDTTSGSGHFTGVVQTGTPSALDPLANLAAPDPSTLASQSSQALSIGGNQVVTLNPGLYVGGISISGSASVTLNPGIYYLQGGGFSVSGHASLTDLGHGVLIYNAPASSSDIISFSTDGNVQLSAMTSGTWAGITLFQARSAANAINVSGTGVLNITGTIYAAAATLNVTGNAGVDSHGTLDTFGTSLILNDLDVSSGGILVA